MKRRHSIDHAEKRNVAMDMATSCVATSICSTLTGNDITLMSQVNRAWWHFVADNRHRLAKKKIQLNITRKSQSKEQEFDYFDGFEKKTYKVPSVCRPEIQVHFMLKQADVLRHYGVVLRKFMPRPHQILKSADSFDPNDINQMAMDSDYYLEVKAVENLEESLHPIIASLANKVNFECLVLIDPTPCDLICLTECFQMNWTSVDRLQVRFITPTIPDEFTDFLKMTRGCSEIKIISDRGTDLPPSILTCNSIKNAKSLDIHLGHFSAVYLDENDEDQAVCSLRADNLRLRAVRFSAKGANALIKQWIEKKRGCESGSLDIHITVDTSRFKKEDVFEGINYEERDRRFHDQYVVSRPGKEKFDKAVVSFIAGGFTFETSSLSVDDDQQRLWF
ncbi:unnamed protein product, partial [Mesorhabditis belari]|uniref:Uncharacterized protein n=1 Tax=Mesorhabditis belari TaxID=2138241 RepID=A0AAF3FTF9_9BILA